MYGLPPDPQMPTRNLAAGTVWTALGALIVGLMGVFSFRTRGSRDA